MRVWLGLALMVAAVGAQGQRKVMPFDAGWRFLQADAPGSEQGGFADESWKTVDVPHDWAIAGPFLETNKSGGAGAFAPAGVGWYRKHFSLPSSDIGKRVYVEFDGVMANSDVWVNGVLLGHRPNGYVSFGYELTGKLKAGDNVLAVRADNSQQPSSRWYEGAGIYRHVRLVETGLVHMVPWGMVVTTPTVTKDEATVHVRSTVVNETDKDEAVSMILDVEMPDGSKLRTAKPITSAAVTIKAHGTGDLDAEVSLPHPELWGLDHPVMHKVTARIGALQKPASDEKTVAFGVREFHFDANTGFWLNGKNIKIKGVALHGDVGALGVAAPVGAWEHRLEALKKVGVNGIRTAHNPPAPEFLDLCDRMGFVVMDEMFDQWTVAKNPYDYHLYFKEWYLKDVRDTVRRDRNHPSVILWSAGNEIHDTPKEELAKSILGPMVEEFHKNDPTRPVTQALFRPNVSHDYDNGLADMLDVIGQNYRPNEILAAHAQKPTRKIIGTENSHGLDQWLPVRDHPEYSGEFLWAGMDYLGEARTWPFIGSGGGIYDRTDAAKPDGLERESWWSAKPVVHVVRRLAAQRAAAPGQVYDPGYEPGSPQALALANGAGARTPAPVARAEEFGRATVFADWSPKNAAAHEETVEVYSNCASVELMLNGRSLGEKVRNADDKARRWAVGFEPGTLRAVGKNGGTVCAEESLKTAGVPAKIKLVVERAKLSTSFDDVGYVRATVTDEQGTTVPDAVSVLRFSASGPGMIVATDNGDNADHSGFQRSERAAYQGSAIAVVRARQATGSVVVAVEGEGLKGASVTMTVGP